MATFDLDARLHVDGTDPRVARGQTVVPPDIVTGGWLNYARTSKLIRWDFRGNEGYGQDGRTSHWATAKTGLDYPSPGQFCRPVFLRNFTVPFDLSGWVLLQDEPKYGNDGFKVAVLHQNNTDMWLAQLLRGNRTASLYQEDRNGPVGGRSWVHPRFDWTPKTVYPWKIHVGRQGLFQVWIGDMNVPVMEHVSFRSAASGRVGFRLDRVTAHFGGLTVKEW